MKFLIFIAFLVLPLTQLSAAGSSNQFTGFSIGHPEHRTPVKSPLREAPEDWVPPSERIGYVQIGLENGPTAQSLVFVSPDKSDRPGRVHIEPKNNSANINAAIEILNAIENRSPNIMYFGSQSSIKARNRKMSVIVTDKYANMSDIFEAFRSRNENIPLELMNHIIGKFLNALKFLDSFVHKGETHHVYHSDLKPANIMRKGIEPILIDFGSAIHIKNSPGRNIFYNESFFCRTPFHYAPEIFADPPPLELDLLALDIWAAGVTILQWLGHIAYDSQNGHSAWEIIRENASEIIELVCEEFGEEFTDNLRGLFAPCPEDRIAHFKSVLSSDAFPSLSLEQHTFFKAIVDDYVKEKAQVAKEEEDEEEESDPRESFAMITPPPKLDLNSSARSNPPKRPRRD